MQKQSLQNLIKAISFLLIAVLLFSLVSTVLERKTYSGINNYMAKMNEFYQLEEHTLDYVCLGSSHAYCTVNPMEIWKETGFRGFTPSTAEQPLICSYYYLKEVFKTQSPKVVFLEGWMGYVENHSESAFYNATDPLKLSFNKLQLIQAIAEPADQANYLFNVLKYHTRWKEMNRQQLSAAFSKPVDRCKGYIPLASKPGAGLSYVPDHQNVEPAILSEENLQALNGILELTQQHNAQLVLIFAPYSVEHPKASAAIKAQLQWAAEHNVLTFDYAADPSLAGIDYRTDYYDVQHLSFSGANKVSRHMANYLSSTLTPSGGAEDPRWRADYEHYQTLTENL